MLEIENLCVRYKAFDAVRGVSFTLREGETLGLVGGSGCGKSSIAKVIAGLQPARAGDVRLDGKSLFTMNRAARLAYHRSVQMVFQDATGSLNPRMRVRDALSEALGRAGSPLPAAGASAEGTPRPSLRERALGLLEQVGLSPDVGDAFPTSLSGGQCQRVSIARCLAVEPRFLVADEPVSSLDVSAQARVMNVLAELQRKLGLALLLISHDLAMVRLVCGRVCVMEAGQIVETGNAAEVMANPRHPAARALVDAIPAMPA
ncbi:MAG: ATP-binding cassette domain-containing protein [Kiritimatiellaeota bacterium]|nr:ATP-binding cassette domain-containing protein [Kiritimatiellota bacterium]